LEIILTYVLLVAVNRNRKSKLQLQKMVKKQKKMGILRETSPFDAEISEPMALPIYGNRTS
jgi:hypothetical protein